VSWRVWGNQSGGAAFLVCDAMNGGHSLIAADRKGEELMVEELMVKELMVEESDHLTKKKGGIHHTL